MVLSNCSEGSPSRDRYRHALSRDTRRRARTIPFAFSPDCAARKHKLRGTQRREEIRAAGIVDVAVMPAHGRAAPAGR